jgi:hypothetical protein
MMSRDLLREKKKIMALHSVLEPCGMKSQHVRKNFQNCGCAVQKTINIIKCCHQLL